jgi:hypothetical protein
MIHLRTCAVAGIAGMALAGCAGNGSRTNDGSSPRRAVATFLAPFPRAVPSQLPSQAEQRRRALALWPTMCDRVDPAIRRGLRVPKEATVPDARTACGAVVVLMVLSTPEGSNVGPAATIAGTPRAAVIHGNISLVTVDVRYRTVPYINAPPTPTGARVKVLVVKRGGRWWVATPEAFNPVYANRGGLTERELRRSYAKLLAAAK